MKIAIISHKYGNNGYVARTTEELDEQIAKEYVSRWKEDVNEFDCAAIDAALQQNLWTDAVMLYFNNHHTDTIYYATA